MYRRTRRRDRVTQARPHHLGIPAACLVVDLGVGQAVGTDDDANECAELKARRGVLTRPVADALEGIQVSFLLAAADHRPYELPRLDLSIGRGAVASAELEIHAKRCRRRLGERPLDRQRAGLQRIVAIGLVVERPIEAALESVAEGAGGIGGAEGRRKPAQAI